MESADFGARTCWHPLFRIQPDGNTDSRETQPVYWQKVPFRNCHGQSQIRRKGAMSLAGNPERWERQKKSPLPDHREEEACGARSYLSRPDRVGVSTSISLLRKPVAVASKGPIPSATLDKIPTKLSKNDCRAAARPEQCNFFENFKKVCFTGMVVDNWAMMEIKA